MFTRTQYLNGECSHRAYYAQFVTTDLQEVLRRRLGVARMVTAYKADPNLNTIPLPTWAGLSILARTNALCACGDYPTLAGSVCILKEAARQVAEQFISQ